MCEQEGGAAVNAEPTPSSRERARVFLSTESSVRMNSSLHAFPFELQFNDQLADEWFQENWQLAFVFSGTYAIGIYFGGVLMKNRQKLDLRTPLMLWSLCLAVFSIFGAIRTSWYVINVLSSDGFRQSVCDTAFFSAPISKFWAFAFTISKVPELGDTVFIVLRKQRLIFLHWYHHITVLLYTWYSYRDRVAGGGWFMSMNYTVHAVMYSYYAARAGGLRVPKPVAVLITTLQIMQMIMGLSVTGLVYRWRDDTHCVSTTNNIMFGSVMYLSYLLLFSSFFYHSYIRGSSRPDESKTMKQE